MTQGTIKCGGDYASDYLLNLDNNDNIFITLNGEDVSEHWPLRNCVNSTLLILKKKGFVYPSSDAWKEIETLFFNQELF